MKIVELRPDSKLLKSNFDGYKLSLEPIPVLKLENIPAPDHVTADSSTEYSFLHSSLYQLHNHLIADPWLHNTAYFFDSSTTIQKVHYDANVGKLKQLIPVFRCSVKRLQGSGGVYNCDFKFISEKYAVLSDGVGTLRILETGDRQKSDEWKSIQEFQPLNGEGFIIQDAKFTVDKGEKFIHVLFLHIEQLDGKFHNIIDWITLKQAEGAKTWEEAARRTIQGKGSLYYLSLDPKCKSIVYSSNHEYKYTLDTVNEIVDEMITEPTIENLQVVESENPFSWNQSGEDITISFKRTAEATKDEFSVKCQQSNIEVKFRSEVLLSSDLFGDIDTDLTTWSLENDSMQLNLVKKDPELFWSYLIPGGPPMDASNDKQPSVLSNVPVSDLNSQMEDCDYGDEGHQDEEFFISRLDSKTHETTHKIFLGSNHPLFSATLRPGFSKAIAVRNDVDCCLWLQNISPSDEDWSMKHEATLHAFGYIQASKRERKYLMCSPDTNLAVICESSRHVFIYKNSYNTAGGLRKRSGPQLTIGQQKLVSFDGSNGDIVGISVENEIILLLTENAICCLQLSIEE